MAYWQGNWAFLVVISLGLASSGCAFGPKAIEQTHGRYSMAVQRVDEEAFLKNIIRIRYLETPSTLDVASIATQYELSAGAEARPFYGVPDPGAHPFETFAAILPFASIGGSNRPTVSFVPHDDSSTTRQFLTPISADTLIFLSQAGWPVSSVLRVWVDRLNGVPNYCPASGPPRQGFPDFARFQRACDLLQAAQDQELMSVRMEDHLEEVSGPIPGESVTAAALVDAAQSGFEYRPREDGKSWSLSRHERRLVLQVNPAGRSTPERAEFVNLLNLRPEADHYELIAASGVPDPASNPSEPSSVIQFSPRSIAQAYFFLANGIEVPESHLSCGLARQPEGFDSTEVTRGIFRIHCCVGRKHRPPPNSYLAVWYRDHWYYVDDRDQETKATLMLMLTLRRLDFKHQVIGAVPTLTLPVGR